MITMSSTYLVSVSLILTFYLILSVHSMPSRRDEYTEESSESGESYESFEMGNPNDRSIGFKKNSTTNKTSKYAFYVTPEASYTQAPNMFKRLLDKNIDDIDDFDKDYYAHYDFEFAKSGTNRANFQEKYLAHQAKHIGKPLVNPNAPPPADNGFGGFAPKPASQGEKDARGLLGGGGGDGEKGGGGSGLLGPLLGGGAGGTGALGLGGFSNLVGVGGKDSKSGLLTL